MPVEIRKQAFQPWQVLQEYEAGQHAQVGGQYGATAVFVGTMRDFNEGDGVSAMTLEHYPEMTERYLERIVEEAEQRWNLLDALIVHRVGEILPADAIVLVAVWSAHRADAFDASRYLMEELKSRAPFWKKERLEGGGERWVEHNTPDPGAVDLSKDHQS
ncbi:MAG: molybdenum cofactor biosynthesis protein MoaE [Gammaproteobacteria bacterium]|nr:molybdenum cofactor biosynthesis protein MoaE [Gammaproteobacteria bacterium]